MAEAQIIVQAPVVVEVIAEGMAPVEVLASAPVEIEVMTEGTQGPGGLNGLDGQDAVIPDPGDLNLYFENGLT